MNRRFLCLSILCLGLASFTRCMLKLDDNFGNDSFKSDSFNARDEDDFYEGIDDEAVFKDDPSFLDKTLESMGCVIGDDRWQPEGEGPEDDNSQCELAAVALSTETYSLSCVTSNPVLGAGSTAKTFRLVEASGDPFVGKMVKLIDDNAHQEFEKEVGILTKLNQMKIPGIIKIFNHAKDNDEETGFMLLEMGTQGTLESYFEDNKDLFKSPKFSLQFLLKLLKAAVSVHKIGKVHGDIKPANIVIDSNGDPLLIDFNAAVDAGYTEENQATPYYQDPIRLFDEKAPIEPAFDIYSLGVVFYQMKHDYGLPYNVNSPCSNVVVLLMKVVRGFYQMNEPVHWLEAFVILKMMASSPLHRLSGSELIALIEQHIDQVPDVLKKEDATTLGEVYANFNYVLQGRKIAVTEDLVEFEGTDLDDLKKRKEIWKRFPMVPKPTLKSSGLGTQSVRTIKPLDLNEFPGGLLPSGKKIVVQQLKFQPLSAIKNKMPLSTKNGNVFKPKGSVASFRKSRFTNYGSKFINENVGFSKQKASVPDLVVRGERVYFTGIENQGNGGSLVGGFSKQAPQKKTEERLRLPPIIQKKNGSKFADLNKPYLRRLSQVAENPKTLKEELVRSQKSRTSGGTIAMMALICLTAVVSLRMAVMGVLSAAERRKAQIVSECDLQLQGTGPSVEVIDCSVVDKLAV